MQNLQAMGWASIWQGINIDVSIIRSMAALYLLFLPAICLLNVVAARVLSKRLATAIFVVWLLPGILSVSGLYSIRAVVPDAYIIGSGGADQLGSVQGALVNSVLLVLVSWSISTLFLHTIRAGKKSKSAFDHLWYMLGLTAVVFYVSDGNLKSIGDKTAEEESNLSSGFSLLEPQFSKISLKCRDVSFANKNQILCAWGAKVQAYIERRAEDNWVVRKYNDAPTSSVLFQLLHSQGVSEQQVISVVRDYNREYCGSANKDSDCQSIPSHINQHPGLVTGEVNLFDQYLLSVEGVLPYLQYNWNVAVKTREKYEEQKAVVNERWAYLVLLFPLFLGIKVSHSSRELFGGIERSVVRTGFKFLVRRFGEGAIATANCFMSVVRGLTRRVVRRALRN
jgi:hypothetical protein